MLNLDIQMFAENKFDGDWAALVKKHTDEEGNFNEEGFTEDLQKQVSGFVAKNTPDKEQMKADITAEIKEETQKEIFAAAGAEGVENVDQWKAYAKNISGGTDEAIEKANRLEKENAELAAKVGEHEATISTLNSTIDNNSKVQELGKSFIPKYASAAKSQVDAHHTKALESDPEAKYEDSINAIKEEFSEWAIKVNSGGETPQGNTDVPLTEEEEAEVNKWREEAGL